MIDLRRRVLFNLLEEISNMKLIGIINKNYYGRPWSDSSPSSDTYTFWTPCTTGKIVYIGSMRASTDSTGIYYGILSSSGSGSYYQLSDESNLYSVGTTMKTGTYGTATLSSTGITFTYTNSSKYQYFYCNALIFEWEP